MLAGRPVIATSGGGVNEIVADGENGLLVPPNDPPALAAAVSRLMKDQELARRIAAQGRASAATRFNIDQTCNDMVEVLGEVITKS